MRRGHYSSLFVALLFLLSCLGAPNIYQEHPVGVDTLTLGEVQESPPQVVATLKGYTGVCERLETRQRLEAEAKTFHLNVVGIYEGPANAECPALTQEYTRRMTLELYGFEPGVYTVRAGSLSQMFSVPAETTFEVSVETLEVALLESYPVQVVVTASGHLRSGCEEIAGISQRLEGDTFFVTILGKAPWAFDCTPVAPPFPERITLQTIDLAPAPIRWMSTAWSKPLPFPDKASQACAGCVDLAL